MQSNYKRMSILSIITFMGVLIMQAFWITDSYNERQSHFKDHIYNVLDEVSREYCSLKAEMEINQSPKSSQQLMDSILASQLRHNDESSDYHFEITPFGTQEPLSFDSGKHFHFTEDLKCNKAHHKTLHLYILNDKSYFFGSILAWVILSSLLIIIGVFALFYNLSFLRKQKKVDRIKSDFISNMTHELKTPIATISVASEMLMKDRVLDDRAKSKRYTTIIHEENQRLKKLVERVMQIALFENGTMRIKLTDMDVHQSIEKSVNAIQMLVEKRAGKLDIQLNAKHHIYPLDATHFSNIITNLIENALKYSGKNPSINISTTDYSEGILISVADKGIGIPKKYQEKVFDRFFRVESGDVQNTQGFGLGLYYVRRVVEAHGGQIKLHSEINEGSRFEIYFPNR